MGNFSFVVMATQSAVDQKRALRRDIRNQIRQFAPDTARQASATIREQGEKWFADLVRKQRGPQTVAIYAALPGEPDLLPLIPLHPELRWILPGVSGDDLRWYSTKSLDDLRPGAFGILEPDASSQEEVPVGSIDLFLVPGMAFDSGTGVRLGRGKGFYDRALEKAAPTATIIGVGFDWQIRQGIPAETHDKPMNAILTETGLRRTGPNALFSV